MSTTVSNASSQKMPENTATTKAPQADPGQAKEFQGVLKKDGKNLDPSLDKGSQSKEGLLKDSPFTLLHKAGNPTANPAATLAELAQRQPQTLAHSKGKGESSQETAQAKTQEGDPEKLAQSASLRGDSILAGLNQTLSVEKTATAEGQARIEDIASKLAERILVSTADAKGNAEVRIQLREEVLPGTEVRIQKNPDGSVNVQFVTNDIRAEQFLRQPQIQELQSMLATNLQVEVRVNTVRTDGSMTADSGQQGNQQQQQGQGGGQGQPGDGRSRQHDLYEDDQGEA